LRIGDTGPAGDAAYSMAALQAARAAGADALYLPVQLAPDGRLATATAANPAEAMTLEELLAAFPEMRAVVELREPSLRSEAALLQAIDSANARERTLVIVDDQELVEVLRQQAPALATATTRPEAEAFLATARMGLTPFYRPAAPALVLDASELSARLVAAAHSRGVQVVAVAGPGADPQALADLGVDAIIAPQP
jgi:glycerophosphoryl diester phosphodiesterase